MIGAPARGRMRLTPAELVSRLNASYWFVPALVMLTGAGLAVSLLLVDEQVSLDPESWSALLRPSSADGARALLSAVIGAMITAISVTFSVSIVALTVAAQHFGPPVLNTFVRDTASQVVLGTFMATFVYAVIALGALDRPRDGSDLPELTVSGAVVLVMLSIGALIFYVHRVSTSLQIGELAADIAVDFRRSLKRPPVSDDAGLRSSTTLMGAAPADAVAITADQTGYVQRVDVEAVVRCAAGLSARIWIRREPGAFVVAGTPLALVHPPDACHADVVRTVRHACVVGRDRTLWHDPEFALKQLVEMALRALSPGVNEPFTAITCIDRITESLAAALCEPQPADTWSDPQGRGTVFLEPQPFRTLLRAGLDPIRLFAGPNPALYARLLEALGELSLVADRPDDAREIGHLEAVVIRAARTALKNPEDLAYVESHYDQLQTQSDRIPPGTLRQREKAGPKDATQP